MLPAKIVKVLTIGALGLITALTVDASARELSGTWITDDDKGAVELKACGDKLCGHIVWLKDPLGKDGKPQRDVNNPDRAAQSRTICGLQVISGLKPISTDSWDGGTVYDPEEGETYSVAIKALGNGNLEVTGYLGMKMLGETHVWRPNRGELAKCMQ